MRSMESPTSVVTPEDVTSVCPYPVQTSVKPRTSTARSHTLTGAGAAPHHMAKSLDRSNSLTCSWFNNGTSIEGTHKRSFALNFSIICNAESGVNLDADMTDPPTNDMASKPSTIAKQ